MRKKKINRPVRNEKKEFAPRRGEGAVKEKVETILILSLFLNSKKLLNKIIVCVKSKER